MSDPPPEMSQSTKAMLAKVRAIVPPMLETFHKGQLGRVAVIGGSADYTGAPYFSAMASARLGCDLSHVICDPSAAPVIKTYSPNLMVHPLLHSTASAPSAPSRPSLAAPILELLPRLHVLVIGPGLGRDPLTHKIIAEIISAARARSMPFVLDADGLFLIQTQPGLVHGYADCILTPNVVEFARLAKALGVDLGSDPPDSPDRCAKLARALGGVTIIQKGKNDIISDGAGENGSAVCDVPGGLKRSGGQGDTLTGALGTFLAWRAAYHEGLWGGAAETMSRAESLLVAAWAGSAITRECSRRAFEKRGRALQASDLTEEVEGAFLGLVGEPKGEEAKL